ncbi:hypothetical protein TB2_034400 [Malus domestica]
MITKPTTLSHHQCLPLPSPPPLPTSPPPSDETTITSILTRLIDSEPNHMPSPTYITRFRDCTIDIITRQDSINWILNVHAHHRFSPLTAFLSVNYFDRFLSSHSLPRHSGSWPFKLLSVLAAKMGEPKVQFILDLQIFEPKFVFDPKTVQRMELRVMWILNWRLRSITPFDFLHHFVFDLSSSSSSLLLASSDLVLSTIRVIDFLGFDFLGFSPSTIAGAAVLCAAGLSVDFAADGDRQGAPFFYERVNKV